MAGKIITFLSTEIEEKLSQLTSNLQKIGITHVGHGLIVGDLTPTAFFSTKEWARKYDDEDLVSRDPVRACAINSNYQIVPWDYIPSKKEQKPVLEERKRYFEAKSGVLISMKHKGFHETFVLGTDFNKVDIIEIINKNFKSIVDHLVMFRNEHKNYYSNNAVFDAK